MNETGIRFPNRRAAGRSLATALAHHRGATATVVLGLARGGVPVGFEVAAALGLPFDAFLVRKLGLPHWPELAMGALATGGAVVRNADLIRSQAITEDQLQEVIEAERVELRRREAAYGVQQAPDLAGRTVILVDDGIATGASMLAAVRAVRAAGAAAVVVAVPVASRTACHLIDDEVDELICVDAPPDFRAVGQAYDDFTQTSDDEVRALLAGHR
ncbi:phosphoribosyltransferase [Mycobacterium sp. Root265]|uniref:phosphoribosyltransferase n=1 Tax=Mycobacterium sp. Root265 TaxID=1736504 RepID=UPI000A402EFE|nr:phosphoribosyltransferase family protein [Mycobacterium sp. Root265]